LNEEERIKRVGEQLNESEIKERRLIQDRANIEVVQ